VYWCQKLAGFKTQCKNPAPFANLFAHPTGLNDPVNGKGSLMRSLPTKDAETVERQHQTIVRSRVDTSATLLVAQMVMDEK